MDRGATSAVLFPVELSREFIEGSCILCAAILRVKMSRREGERRREEKRKEEEEEEEREEEKIYI